MTSRPTFFLSSTIYDFRDLRSAIKHSLEARGCRVLASEFNDFVVDPHSHSYEACLRNIAQADYFVLLIGTRVGGWYDQAARVSITQQEYREAYRRHQTEGLKIVSLVRNEVWQAREDRKELTRHLRGLGLSPEQQTAIARYPSKFMEDADFISAFLTEVGRNRETSSAVKGEGAMPTGNWIYPFSTFKEVEEVLQPLTFSGLTADDAAYRKALQFELVEILRRLLLKHDGEALDPRGTIMGFFADNPITPGDLDRPIAIDVKRWNTFSGVMMRTLGTRIEPVVVNDALTSPIFMTYDRDRHAYVPSPAYNLLSQLCDEIGAFNRQATAETLSPIFGYSPVRTGARSGTHHIPTKQVLPMIALALRWSNIITICEALAQHLEGRPLPEVRLLPFSPVAGLQSELDRENLTAAETRVFFGI